jgi:NAD+ kinase
MTPSGRGGSVTIRRIGLIFHTGRPVAVEVAETVRAWARDHGVGLSDVDVWDESDGVPRRHARDEAAAGGHPDLIVTVGGDGTFLRGARIAAHDNAAVLGVNVGTLGFLTEVEPAGITAALDACLDGGAQIEERLTLTVRASRPLVVPTGMDALLRKGRGPTLPPPPAHPGQPGEPGCGVALDVIAVNDVVFEKLVRDRQASLAVYLDGRLFASYSADALVVSTPTGSTAYSFAAGGPVLSPRLDALVLTPVAPHMIFNRSLVLADDEIVAVSVLDESGPIAVSIDGQLRGVLDPGDWIAVHRCERRVRMVRFQRTDFFGRLRSRFSLADAPATQPNRPMPDGQRPGAPVPDDIARLFRF